MIQGEIFYFCFHYIYLTDLDNALVTFIPGDSVGDEKNAVFQLSKSLCFIIYSSNALW